MSTCITMPGSVAMQVERICGAFLIRPRFTFETGNWPLIHPMPFQAQGRRGQVLDVRRSINVIGLRLAYRADRQGD